jgi:uncharacterized protein YdaU (DUF1376 family)
MKVEWYPWYPELYYSDTRHLTAEQDGIYRRLIDEYMKTRQPLPNNEIALAGIARISLDSWRIASAIITPFFKEDTKGFLQHDRCNKELSEQDKRAKTMSELGKNGAKKRWENQKVNSERHSEGHSASNATGQDKTEQDKKVEREKFILPDWILKEDWNGYSEMRIRKRKPMTDIAKNMAISKLDKLRQEGHDVSLVIKQSIFHSWETFYPPKPDFIESMRKPEVSESKEAIAKNEKFEELQATENKSLTEAFRREIKNKIGGASYRSWIEPTVILLDEKEIKIISPNRFICDWIKSNYSGDIETFAKNKKVIIQKFEAG